MNGLASFPGSDVGSPPPRPKTKHKISRNITSRLLTLNHSRGLLLLCVGDGALSVAMHPQRDRLIGSWNAQFVGSQPPRRMIRSHPDVAELCSLNAPLQAAWCRRDSDSASWVDNLLPIKRLVFWREPYGGIALAQSCSL